jgi:hypothetical protein
MTLSLLLYTLMLTTLVILAGVLVADGVRALSRASARRTARLVDRTHGRASGSRPVRTSS